MTSEQLMEKELATSSSEEEEEEDDQEQLPPNFPQTRENKREWNRGKREAKRYASWRDAVLNKELRGSSSHQEKDEEEEDEEDRNKKKSKNPDTTCNAREYLLKQLEAAYPRSQFPFLDQTMRETAVDVHLTHPWATPDDLIRMADTNIFRPLDDKKEVQDPPVAIETQEKANVQHTDDTQSGGVSGCPEAVPIGGG